RRLAPATSHLRDRPVLRRAPRSRAREQARHAERPARRTGTARAAIARQGNALHTPPTVTSVHRKRLAPAVTASMGDAARAPARISAPRATFRASTAGASRSWVHPTARDPDARRDPQTTCAAPPNATV